MNSPALSDISLNDEELDAYFANSYVPPSLWPTPPPVTPKMMSEREYIHRGMTDSFTCPVTGEDFLGPATHLANIIPANACLNQPSAPRIAHYLCRSSLPVELIAFAACILDSLSSRFAPTWLEACRNIVAPSVAPSCSSTFPTSPFVSSLQRNRRPVPVDPELVVLAALSISSSYHQDHSFSKDFWTNFVAEEQFSRRQLNVTISAVLENLNYRLQVFTSEKVQESLDYMRRVGMSIAMKTEVEVDNATGVAETQGIDIGLKEKRETPILPILQGTSVWMNGQYTPEPSP